MPVLYRDYRPKNFAGVINQEHIKTTLQKAVASGFFAHAYLFTGPRGTGKTSVARILARAVNCPKQKDGEPCNACDICKQFLENTSLDLVEIDAASNTGVENVREIIEHLKFSPSAAKYKVFIIDEVHMLSKGAFNALLKTLEEPPAHAIFILATTEIHKVPATVISRTQRFDFKKITNTDLMNHLSEIAKKEKIKVDKETLELVVNSAEGSVRDALSILDKLSAFDAVDIKQAEQLLGITNILASQKLLDFITAKDAQGGLSYLLNLFAGGADPVQLNKDFLEYLRKVLMLSMGAEINYPLDEGQKNALQNHAKQIRPAELLHIIRLFLRANKDFAISPNPELPMEIALAESCLTGNDKGGGDTGSAQSATTPKPSQAPQSTPTPMRAEMEISAVPEVKAETPRPRTKPEKIVPFNEIYAAWPDVLQELKQQASSIFAIMKTVEVDGAEDNVLKLRCKYKFHKDSLESARNSSIILKVLENHFGTSFALSILVQKDEAPENLATDNAILEAFGGELA